jgi:hypothetical protein
VSFRTRLTALEMDVAQAKRDRNLEPRWERELAALREQLKHPAIHHGIDFAYGRPSPALLKQAGMSFVCRYYSPEESKDLSRSEAEDYSQAGISIVTVWESAASAYLGGHAAGVADAKAAERCRDEIKQPLHSPIFFAVDAELQPEHETLAKGYFTGLCDVLERDRVGVYGGLATVELAYRTGLAGYLWQTLAWSGGEWYVHAMLRQITDNVTVAGISADVVVGLAADFGQWKL